MDWSTTFRAIPFLEKLPERLAEIAQRHRDMLDRLAVLDIESPEIKELLESEFRDFSYSEN